jgi:rubrerythrin
MTERKTLKCSPDTKARFDMIKRDGETTDGLLNRAFDALEAEENRERAPGVPRCSDCGSIADVWTVEEGDLLCPLCAEGEVDPDWIGEVAPDK